MEIKQPKLSANQKWQNLLQKTEKSQCTIYIFTTFCCWLGDNYQINKGFSASTDLVEFETTSIYGNSRRSRCAVFRSCIFCFLRKWQHRVIENLKHQFVILFNNFVKWTLFLPELKPVDFTNSTETNSLLICIAILSNLWFRNSMRNK